ncbi:MAG: PilZ domain-containing protein [Thermoleophilaceae bacterium]
MSTSRCRSCSPPLNAEGKPYGQPVETRTRDVSADGVLVEAKISPDLPGLHISLPLPDGLPTFECNVRVVRQLGWGSGLRYSGISDETRARLKEFVAETKHLQLLDEQESEAAW